MKVYLALGGVLALLIAFGAGLAQGHRAERESWDLAAARQARDAAQLIANAEARARAKEQELAALKDQIEKEHRDAEVKIAAARSDNARLLAAIGGLRDPQGSGSCRRDLVPTDTVSAAVAPGSAPGGCQLSDATSRDLLDLAALADRTAAYAAACHAWVQRLR